MTIADDIYSDPRTERLDRGELTELLAECVNQIGLDDCGRASNGDVVDALFIALAHLPIDDVVAAKLRSLIDEYFE